MQISSGHYPAPQSIFIPLSSKWKWQTQDKLFNAAIKDLSYEVMLKFEHKIAKEKRWEKWKQCIQKELKVVDPTPRIFVKSMIEQGFRIRNLLSMADKIDDTAVEKCFYKDSPSKYMEQEVPRIKADKDTSNGFLIDISDKTLKGIADLVETNPHWRKMGDGLGFSLSDCIGFTGPFEMLKQWSIKFPNGTLRRISYEAARLNLQNVCRYLNAIPLHKHSTVEIRDPHASHPQLRMTTIFDMDRLEGIYKTNSVQIDWKVISGILFNDSSAEKDDIWLSGNVQLKHLNEAMNRYYEDHAECFDEFMDDIRTGYFEPRTVEDVSYNQVAYLAEGINIREFNRHPNFEELVKKYLRTCSFRVTKISVRTFLNLYWQLNRELNLSTLVQKMINEFLPYDYQIVILKSFNLMNPKRYFSTSLYEKNQRKDEGFLRV